MEKKINTSFMDQKRWNDVCGASNLNEIKTNPELFIIEPRNVSKSKQDLIDVMTNSDTKLIGLENKRILEFGSGRGEFSVLLAKLGGRVIGIDIGSDLIELSKLVAELNNVKCDFVVGSIDKLPFEDNSFDFVVGNGILHHLPKQGVLDSLNEAYRVLKPDGIALFTEPIENSKFFNFLQNLLPLEKPGNPQYRPSILQRKRWKKYLFEADDRDLTNKELIFAKGSFRNVDFKYYGFLIRLARIFPNEKFSKLLTNVDLLFTHRLSPFKKLSQGVFVVYRK